MASVFVSPGVYTKVQDFTAFASRVGITRLGIVGRFPKGPAFEAIAVPTSGERYERFGATNYDYPATYVADSFLSQSNELTISRILGKSGFTNSRSNFIRRKSLSRFLELEAQMIFIVLILVDLQKMAN